MDYERGHYQIFTANKSIDDIDENVKWMFENSSKFTPDTMACQRVTTFRYNADMQYPALFIVSLFKNDYPDLRLLRVCSQCCPLKRYYGSELKSDYEPEDSVCKKPCDIELFSRSLAKTVAAYYIFDCGKESFRAVSSGGDIGYRGVINSEKIKSEAQKMSFLAGVFMRYGWIENGEEPYMTYFSGSFSAAKTVIYILKKFGCRHADYIEDVDVSQERYRFVFTPSSKIRQLLRLVYKLKYEELLKGFYAF
jgi:hypothetical protein